MKKILTMMLLCAACMLVACDQKEDTNGVVSDIKLNKNTLSLLTGDKETLTATILPEDVTNKQITWSSTDPEVASVSKTGDVRALKQGTATITAKSDNDKTASCEVTVARKISITEISIDEALSLVIGQEKTLTPTITPDNASRKEVKWTSSNESIATVNQAGVVKGIAKGSAIITVKATDGGKTAKCNVTVTGEEVFITEIRLNYPSYEMVIDRSLELKVTFTPTDATNKELTWTSSNQAVATVDNNGMVKAIKVGATTITATTKDGGKTATCQITVGAPTLINTVWEYKSGNNRLSMLFNTNGTYQFDTTLPERGTYTNDPVKKEVHLQPSGIRAADMPPRTLKYELTGTTLTITDGALTYAGTPGWITMPCTLTAM